MTDFSRVVRCRVGTIDQDRAMGTQTSTRGGVQRPRTSTFCSMRSTYGGSSLMFRTRTCTVVHERAVGIDVERVRDCQTSTPTRVTLLRQRKCTRSRRFHTRQDDGFLYVLDTHGRLRQAIGTGSNRPL